VSSQSSTPSSRGETPLLPAVWRPALLLALCGCVATSCALRQLKQNVRQINAHGVVWVSVSPVHPSAPTYALAWTPTAQGTNEMIGFQPVGPDGMALFLLRLNRTCQVGAFSDLDGDGAYDGGEPVDTSPRDPSDSAGGHRRSRAPHPVGFVRDERSATGPEHRPAAGESGFG
jgi:hypothetical protein